MSGRFIVLSVTFAVTLTTACMGQSVLRFQCDGDRCCYPDGRCFSRHSPFSHGSTLGAPAPSLPGPSIGAPVPSSPRPSKYPNSVSGPQPNHGPKPDVLANPPSAGPVVGAPSVVRIPPGAPPSVAPGATSSRRSERSGNATDTQATGTPKSPRILETGYARLDAVGEEKPGYGLYSYVLITSYSNKSVALLNEMFKVIPNVKNTAASPNQINILYIPFLKEKEIEFSVAAQSHGTLGEKYAESFYNFQMARAILDHLCNPPADVLRQLCGSDLSRGPFIFTYEKPASTFEPVQAPYLFVDLRDVHEHAFAEFVSAYQEQVKTDNVNAGERLNTLRLKFLNLTLNAADFFKPVPEALADVIHSAALKPQGESK